MNIDNSEKYKLTEKMKGSELNDKSSMLDNFSVDTSMLDIKS